MEEIKRMLSEVLNRVDRIEVAQQGILESQQGFDEKLKTFDEKFNTFGESQQALIESQKELVESQRKLEVRQEQLESRFDQQERKLDTVIDTTARILEELTDLRDDTNTALHNSALALSKITAPAVSKGMVE